MKHYPEHFTKGILNRRINRFVAEVTADGIKFDVYVPNTGRLSELALPGTEVLLSEINAKYRYKILYIINRSFPVMIDSSYSNRLFQKLLSDRKVPLPFNYHTVKSEPVFGSHRFDFLLQGDSGDTFIELKSCTLFHKSTGAFPDAVSTRASEHVRELAASGKGRLVFLVLRSDIEKFVPNYHTDFMFYETLREFREMIDPRAYAVQYDSNLDIHSLKEIPVIIPDAAPSGVFIILVHNTKDHETATGIFLKKGFYVYCGYDAENIFKSVSSFRRKFTSGAFMHGADMKYLKIIADVPIADSSVTTDFVMRILKVHGASVRFTDSNSACIETVYFIENPAERSWFWNSVLEMRFGKFS